VVVDHFGGPIAGARVLGDTRSGFGAATTLTDDAGRFELWTGNQRVSVSASGYGAVGSYGPWPDLERRIELYPEAALEGTVWDADGTARAEVQVELHSKWLSTQVTSSDVDGKFRFSGLAPGEFELRASEGGEGAGPERVRMPMGEVVSRDLILEPRATVSGTIGFASGEACTDVSGVSLSGNEMHRYEWLGLGADAGEYRFAGVPVGTYRLVGACSEAALDVKATLEVSGADDVTYDVVFEERAASIHGVVDGVSDPTEWIVTARRASSDPKLGVDVGYRSCRVDKAAKFSVTGLGEGTWILDVRASAGDGNHREGPGTEVVLEHEDVRGVRLRPEEVTMVEMTAVLERGDPVAGDLLRVYRVERYTRSCTTDDDGRCELGLPGEPPFGELVVSAAGRRILCEGEWRRVCPMHLDELAVQLVLEPVTSLEGRLTDASDGSGLGFAEISATRAEEGWEARVATARTDEDGSFVLTGLPAHDESLALKVTCPAGDRAPVYVPVGSTPSVACDVP
jgi:hypothetical protein